MSRCLTCGRYSATWPSCAKCGPYHLSIPSWAVPNLSEFAADDGSIDEAGALQWLRENELAAWPESFVQAPCRAQMTAEARATSRMRNQATPSKEDSAAMLDEGREAKMLPYGQALYMPGNGWTYKVWRYRARFNCPTFTRAGGLCICQTCGLEYRRHPQATEWLDWQGEPWLRRLCNGTLVKL